MTGLTGAHREYLTAHAITDEMIDAAGIDSYGDMIVFPWRDGPLVTYQTRPYPGPKDYRWNQGFSGKPLHLAAWRPMAPGDGPVIIAEGTKQALAVASHAPPQYAVYGMQGCRGWANENLARFAGRDVLVMLDADAGSNADVYDAGDKLSAGLASAGARPCFVPSPSWGKGGIDDYLATVAPQDRAAAMAAALTVTQARPAARRPPEPAVVALADEIESALMSTKELRDRPLPVPLVDDWLYLDSLAWAKGNWGSGKTITCTDIAGCVATGKDWHGRRVRQGPVLYFALESAAGFRQRVEAWETLNGREWPGSPVYVRPVNLLAPAEADAVVLVCERVKPVLVVIDTQSRAMPGTDEGNTDYGLLVRVLDRIREACGACVLLIHHKPRFGDNMRGGTVLEAAATTIIDVEGDGRTVTLRTDGEHGGRQKDAPDPHPLTLAIVPAGPGVALDYAGPDAEDEPGPDARKVLAVLSATPDELSTTVIIELAKVSKGGAHRGLSELIAAGKITRRQVGNANFYRSVTSPDGAGEVAGEGFGSPDLPNSRVGVSSQVKGATPQTPQTSPFPAGDLPNSPPPYRGGEVPENVGKQHSGTPVNGYSPPAPGGLDEYERAVMHKLMCAIPDCGDPAHEEAS